MEILDSIVLLKVHGKEKEEDWTKKEKEKKDEYAASHDYKYDSLMFGLMCLSIWIPPQTSISLWENSVGYQWWIYKWITRLLRVLLNFWLCPYYIIQLNYLVNII